jgi:antirestriction protein ArdC
MKGRFGDQSYGAGQLVAEIGAAFLCELGISQEARVDHAQYLANWLQLFKHDNRAIFTAAVRASEAVVPGTRSMAGVQLRVRGDCTPSHRTTMPATPLTFDRNHRGSFPL